MNKHHLGLLIAAAVIALVAGLWASKVQEPAVGSGAGAPLLPGLAEAVNDVNGVKLTGPGNQLIATLTRDEETWRLAERAGYPANVPEVRELLLKLARAKLLEEKTANPEYYGRLGVEDIAAADAGGVLVEIEGIDVAPVIIGDTEPAREAVYARRADEAISWLASGAIDIATDVTDWISQTVIDIDASRIAEVEVTHPDGEVVRVYKSEFGQAELEVADIPDGRELKRSNIANTMASVIDALQADDVQTLDESGFADLEATRVAWRAFDGFVVQAEVATKDDQYYAKFGATTDAAIAARYLPVNEATDTESGDAAADDAAGPPAPPEADISVVAEEAAQQNKRLENWVYLLPKFKYDQMTRRMEDLLKEPTS